MGPSLRSLRLAVGGWPRLAVGGWWRLAAIGGGWCLVVGGWWGLAVGGWWRLAVGGPWGRSLRVVLNKKKFSGFLRTPCAHRHKARYPMSYLRGDVLPKTSSITRNRPSPVPLPPYFPPHQAIAARAPVRGGGGSGGVLPNLRRPPPPRPPTSQNVSCGKNDTYRTGPKPEAECRRTNLLWASDRGWGFGATQRWLTDARDADNRSPRLLPAAPIGSPGGFHPPRE